MSFEFEWDDAKAKANLKKHGVPFAEALTAFVDPLARILDDPDHSETEARDVVEIPTGSLIYSRVIVSCSYCCSYNI